MKKILSNKINLFLFIPILASFLFLILFSQTYAQNDNVNLEIFPEIPGPNENVSFTLISYSTDLDRAEIFWYLNNKLTSSGVGKKTFSSKTNSVGSSIVIDVVIKTSNIGRVNLKRIIIPAEVDLLWEADGYVPPFYKGKSLPSSEGSIKVVAFPNFITPSGTKLKSSNLIYEWKKNRKVLGNQSGYNKRVMNFPSGYVFSNEKIEAQISSQGRSLSSVGRVNINIGEPQILFYEKHPLLGILYEKELGREINLNKAEISIVAEPYFFSPQNKKSSQLSYEWSLNGQKINNTNRNRSDIILRQENGNVGVANLSLNIENTSKILQEIKKTIIVNFKQSASSFSF